MTCYPATRTSNDPPDTKPPASTGPLQNYTFVIVSRKSFGHKQQQRPLAVPTPPACQQPSSGMACEAPTTPRNASSLHRILPVVLQSLSRSSDYRLVRTILLLVYLCLFFLIFFFYFFISFLPTERQVITVAKAFPLLTFFRSPFLSLHFYHDNVL